MVQRRRQHDELLRAFREDHRILGRAFHELSRRLRAGDTAAAAAVARQLDAAAGAHIAFEEKQFYPALERLLGGSEVQRLYGEHGNGLAVVRALVAEHADAALAEGTRQRLLQQSEAMEEHIADCGELFAAIGRIPVEEQQALYQTLLEWRRRGPKWTAYAVSRDAAGSARAD